jgi:hypothetical protein
MPNKAKTLLFVYSTEKTIGTKIEHAITINIIAKISIIINVLL